LKVIDYGLLKDLDVVFTGHYHSQKIWEIDGIKIVRPGDLENKINFGVYDTKTGETELIND
jgi:predicted phosphodiesterase